MTLSIFLGIFWLKVPPKYPPMIEKKAIPAAKFQSMGASIQKTMAATQLMVNASTFFRPLTRKISGIPMNERDAIIRIPMPAPKYPPYIATKN